MLWFTIDSVKYLVVKSNPQKKRREFGRAILLMKKKAHF